MVAQHFWQQFSGPGADGPEELAWYTPQFSHKFQSGSGNISSTKMWSQPLIVVMDAANIKSKVAFGLELHTSPGAIRKNTVDEKQQAVW